jgi:hypothetical protein
MPLPARIPAGCENEALTCAGDFESLAGGFIFLVFSYLFL